MTRKPYEVGYRKPPKTTRFKPGRSGNPRGRPKGSRNFKTDLLEELDDKIRVSMDGRGRTLSKRQALLKQLVTDALKGQWKARQLVVGLMAGLDRDSEGMTSEEGSPDTERVIFERSIARMGYVKKGKGHGQS